LHLQQQHVHCNRLQWYYKLDVCFQNVVSYGSIYNAGVVPRNRRIGCWIQFSTKTFHESTFQTYDRKLQSQRCKKYTYSTTNMYIPRINIVFHQNVKFLFYKSRSVAQIYGCTIVGLDCSKHESLICIWLLFTYPCALLLQARIPSI
jgi:hypothetical protein